MKPKISFIIPAYNESQIIGKSIDRVYKFLKSKKYDFEIIVGDDGSTDRQPEIIKKKMKKYPGLKYVRNKKNSGKGNILTNCFKVAQGNIQVFCDADLSIDINHLPEMISKIIKGADIVIVSKNMKQAVSNYPLPRKLASNGFAFMTRMMLNTKLSDHQCGFKAFKQDVISYFTPKMKSNGWLWDAEILARATYEDYKISEIPARLKESGTRTSKIDLKKDIYRFTKSLIGLRQELKKEYRT
ncbi:glycosyltransferase [Candidatus Woesearchaeota archaeon]|nr:glycosyltransferase [Candidatus Woesearchaeota archaeon]